MNKKTKRWRRWLRNGVIALVALVRCKDEYQNRHQVAVFGCARNNESGFSWLPFGKLELQFYSIRHVQHHTGELCERLGTTGDIEVGWVG